MPAYNDKMHVFNERLRNQRLEEDGAFWKDGAMPSLDYKMLLTFLVCRLKEAIRFNPVFLRTLWTFGLRVSLKERGLTRSASGLVQLSRELLTHALFMLYQTPMI